MFPAVNFCQTLPPVPCRVHPAPEHVENDVLQLRPPAGALICNETDGLVVAGADDRRPTYMVSVCVDPGVTPALDVRLKLA
jgi:hypothetical protein